MKMESAAGVAGNTGSGVPVKQQPDSLNTHFDFHFLSAAYVNCLEFCRIPSEIRGPSVGKIHTRPAVSLLAPHPALK